MKLFTFLKSVVFVGACCLLPVVPVLAAEVNLLSLQEGCLPVVVPLCYGGWACEQGKIAGNASELGRAQNRRVELVRR